MQAARRNGTSLWSTMPPDSAAYSKFSNTGIRIRPPLWNRIEWARTTFEYESNIDHITQLVIFLSVPHSLLATRPPPAQFSENSRIGD